MIAKRRVAAQQIAAESVRARDRCNHCCALWLRSPRRQDRVNPPIVGVKESSETAVRLVPECTLCALRSPSGRPEPTWERSMSMADLAYAVLLVGVFLVLALTLRGLERL